MSSKPAIRTEFDAGSEEPSTVFEFDYGIAPIKYKKQIADFRRYLEDKWGDDRIPDTDAGHRDAAPMAAMLAMFADGPARIDQFFAASTCFDPVTRRRLKEAALSTPKWYSPKELGGLADLKWATRKRLNLTNIDAIDTPPEHILDELYRDHDAAYQRRKRAEKASLGPAGKRKAAEQLNRRVLAIHTVIGPEGMPVADICKALKRQKNGPFSAVDEESLPPLVRRVVKADGARQLLQWRIEGFDGRPDLRPQLCVFRRSPRDDQETIVSNSPPADAEQYRLHFADRLAQFTSENDRFDIARWFNSEKSLRDLCGVADQDVAEFVKLARTRVHELFGPSEPQTDRRPKGRESQPQ